MQARCFSLCGGDAGFSKSSKNLEAKDFEKNQKVSVNPMGERQRERRTDGERERESARARERDVESHKLSLSLTHA